MHQSVESFAIAENLIYVLFALFLVFLNGFFVAAEFAMVKLRNTQAVSLSVHYGNLGVILKKVHNNLDQYLSACQLGITLASLGLGWVGEPAFANLVSRSLFLINFNVSDVTLHNISIAISFTTISFLHIVLGELAPKSLAIQKPEQLSLWTAAPLYAFYWSMYPFIIILNKSAALILLIFGQNGDHSRQHQYSKEELKLILHSSSHENPDDQQMHTMLNVAEISELDVADWANSRLDLIYINLHDSVEQILSTIKRYKFSRIPVYDESKNEFIGILHIKDLLMLIVTQGKIPEIINLKELVRPVEKVFRHHSLAVLLEKMRQGGSHFALVTETDNNVIGFLTMEDVLEVLVGDIQDEHKKIERSVIVFQPGKLLVRGDTPLFRIERALNIDLDDVESDTVAGLVYDVLKRVPDPDETIEAFGLIISIKKMRGPKIMLAKVTMNS